MKRVRIQRIAKVTLSLMTVMATLFANVQCRGRCYEPVVPEKLRK
ncbi:MAG: cyclic lactone autoinducer peptide [Lachnospiraceae bacterium]|nr:cyclic lactone autoinducer peptide [Lachnospiraceae bacterium]